jgi:hypothetical protein
MVRLQRWVPSRWVRLEANRKGRNEPAIYGVVLADIAFVTSVNAMPSAAGADRPGARRSFVPLGRRSRRDRCRRGG